MKIGPLFKWFGSKWQSAKHYPRPEHHTIVEPFAGGAGYSLNFSDRNVILCEADCNVFMLWSWLIRGATQSDILDIPINLPVGTDIRTLDLSVGQSLLLKHWQRTNNVGDCWTISPWGDKPGQWTANTRARVSEEVSAIKHWTIVDRVDENLARKFPATWFIDPPYQYNYRYRKDLPPMDYQHLACFVRSIEPYAQIIVCEAVGKGGEIPDWLPFRPSHRAITSRRKSAHSKELIWTNDDFSGH